MAVASAQRAGPLAVKKAPASVDAPIWKNYLAIRSLSASAKHSTGRSMKRSKPTSGGDAAKAAGRRLPMPAIAASDATAGRVRQYWEQLSAMDRQQVLYLDEPDLVKQLYKLNLSLLCVGLMQRHLKAKALGISLGEKEKKEAASTSTTPNAAAKAVDKPQSPAKPMVRSLLARDDPTEETYELLEAMEFMDIGTGILTVKSELVESTERLFSLVGDVLVGFLSTVHVLTDAQFRSLFVTESEVINTWEDYQRLIAMLIEQLILRSYVRFLEKRALQQMEELLLEESREDTISADAGQKKKKKRSKKPKKKKKKAEQQPVAAMDKATVAVEPTKAPSSHTDCSDFADDLDEESSCLMEEASGAPPANVVESEEADDTRDCASPAANGEPEPEIACEGSRSDRKRLQERRLNPNAAAFHPQVSPPLRSQSAERKRKLDKYILRVPIEDVEDDEQEERGYGRMSAEEPASDAEDDAEDDPDLGRWTKIRRFEDDAALEWQLQQVYASTSALFGWDFSRQQEIPEAAPGALPWNDATFWRTAPHDVVRYFSPGFGEPFLSHGAPSPQSRYYFSPPPFLPTPPFAAELPTPRDAFAYRGSVVSSPDFSAPDPEFRRKDAR